MIKSILEKLIEKTDLTFNDAFGIMEEILNGRLNNSQLAGILIALKMKGETPIEIAGFASAMRNYSIRINSNSENTIDVCGTGGDSSGSINISTAVAFVVAGTGIKVAKHGNRSITSYSGSADVLEEMGININLTPSQSEKALDTIGISFLFAPNYHPAMKYVSLVRKELGFKTVFNLLGPLTNPAGVKKQLVGTYNYKSSELLASAAQLLDFERVNFVCSNNSFDEISLSGEENAVFEFDNKNGQSKYFINNETFGYPSFSNLLLTGKDANYNASKILELFEFKMKDALYYNVCANAAMALYSAKYSENFNDCILAAEASIESGAALDKVNKLRAFR
ncbi:MAG: anthranilate phosphoribosyltransferase [Ignavibacteriaceae bacterium]|nr:anthranilate phosphoribosyltransferase [Ignavibacteriaceae bacterium]